MTSSATPDLDLRRLLSRSGSYPVIAAAVATGRLPQLPVRLFEHVGDVYRRVETAADDDFTDIAALRLAALVHEEPPESLSRLLASTGVSDLTPIVLAVIGGFGRIWKIRPADDLHAYVEASRPHLASVLLFEVAHEGRATVSMERVADLGALRPALTRWTARLARPNR